MKYTKKHILQVLPNLFFGGVERGAVDIAKALIDQGFISSIAVASGDKERISLLQNYGVNVFILPQISSKNPIIQLIGAYKLSKLCKTHKIDLLHVRSRAPAWAVVWMKHLFHKMPTISTFHGVYGAKNWVKRFYNSSMLRHDFVIVGTEYMRDHIQNTYCAFQVPELKRIYRGIDEMQFSGMINDQSSLNNEQFKQNFNIPKDKKIILLPGRLSRVFKAQHIFLESLKNLKNQNVHGVILGGDPNSDTETTKAYRAELLKYAEFENLNISFIHASTEIQKFYHIADIVVSASIKPESFGRVIAEAMMMKKIVIATNHGGGGELIDDGITGFHCEVKDAKSLAKTIDRVLALSSCKIDKIQNAAHTKAIENYSLTSMLTQTIDCYNSIIR